MSELADLFGGRFGEGLAVVHIGSCPERRILLSSLCTLDLIHTIENLVQLILVFGCQYVLILGRNRLLED